MDGKVLLLTAAAGYRTGKRFSYSNKVVDFCTEEGTCLCSDTEEQAPGASLAGSKRSHTREMEIFFTEISTLGKK